jgi:superfamily II DNA or RNA helicase
MKELFSVNPWPHQLKAVEELLPAIAPGKWICVTSPTGGGKSKIMEAVCRYAANNGMKVDLKVHRKLLLEQLIGVFERAQVSFGVRAATEPKRFAEEKLIQISSMPTEHARCKGENPKWRLHDADIVIVDEAHLQVGHSSSKILQQQAANGACIILVTATPIGLPPVSKLIVAGKNSELRECGSHVPAVVKAPFEFDLSKVRREKTGEYAMGDVTKSVFSQAVVGSILQETKKANPSLRPILIFAPDVQSSIWIAKHFTENGVPTAHIDGSSVWHDGELHKDYDGSKRREVMRLFEAGEIKAVSNRFVLREAVDCPFIYHLVLACPFGSLKTYLQSVGRALRYSPTTPDHVLISDHAGNIHRHGSPNLDRDWESIYSMTEEELADEQREREKKSDEDPPIICPNCGTVRVSGSRCPEPPIGCGQESGIKGKVIIQRGGSLRTIKEEELREKYTIKEKSAQELWDEVYWALRNSKKPRGMNFKQARVLFKKKHGYWPPFGLRNMPKNKADESIAVRELQRSELT